jgi:hypothetical protein
MVDFWGQKRVKFRRFLGFLKNPEKSRKISQKISENSEKIFKKRVRKSIDFSPFFGRGLKRKSGNRHFFSLP